MSTASCPIVDHQLVLDLGFGLRKGDSWSCCCLGVERASVKGKCGLTRQLGCKVDFMGNTWGSLPISHLLVLGLGLREGEIMDMHLISGWKGKCGLLRELESEI